MSNIERKILLGFVRLAFRLLHMHITSLGYAYLDDLYGAVFQFTEVTFLMNLYCIRWHATINLKVNIQ